MKDLESRLEKAMADGFKHLEQLMRQDSGNNDKEHEHFRSSIYELYNENKKIREEIDKRCQSIVNEFDSKIETQRGTISVLEQRQSADEGKDSGKQLSNNMLLTIIGLGFAGITALQVLLSVFGG